MMSPQMGMPAAAPSPEEMALFDQMRQNISPKEFSDEMLAGATQVDPQAVAEFRQELEGLDVPPEVLDALNDLVDEILANPERYDEIRQKYIGQGIPEDILPEQFDPNFFAALNMAVDQLIAEPAGPQAFAKGGIAELKPIAKAIASYGRNGDTMLAHITPAEARMLRRRGGSGTINPHTGLPEFFLKSIGKIFKKIGNAVKKFASSTVGRIVTTIALGFFLGPAAASALGVSSAAGVAAVSGFVGSAGSTLLGGGNLRDALKAGAIGGLTAGAGAGIMGGSEAFAAGSYTGPTTVSGQFDKFKSAFTPGPLQQAAPTVSPTTFPDQMILPTGQVPGTAPVPTDQFIEPGSAPMGPETTAPGTPTPTPAPVGIDATELQGTLAKPGASEGIADRFKEYWDKNISPGGIREAGTMQAENAGLKAMEALKARLPSATPEMLEKAYQAAKSAAMPSALATYGPITAVGIGALGAAGGFKSKPAELTPEAQEMRDRLAREKQMMIDNPGMFTPKGFERFGAVYDDKGRIVSWNPWSPASAGAFEQYSLPPFSPYGLGSLATPPSPPPPPPPLPGLMHGGMVSGYAEGGDVTGEIQNWWKANEGKGDQAALDKWLATSGYSASQISKALPQFSVTDLNKAITLAKNRQEVIDRQEGRGLYQAAHEKLFPGTAPGFVITPHVDDPRNAYSKAILDEVQKMTAGQPAKTYSTTSAVPQEEIEAYKARLRQKDPNLAEFMEWRLGEMDPMQHQRIGALMAGKNPYDLDDNQIAQFRAAMERGAQRAGGNPEWMQSNWRETQAARNAAYDAEQERRRKEAAGSGFVIGPGGTPGSTGGGTTTPPPPSGPPISPPPPPPGGPPIGPPGPPPPPPPPTAIPWNLMPEFKQYAEYTKGTPLVPTYSVLGDTVYGMSDPFGAGKGPLANAPAPTFTARPPLPSPTLVPANYNPLVQTTSVNNPVHTSNPDPNNPVFNPNNPVFNPNPTNPVFNPNITEPVFNPNITDQAFSFGPTSYAIGGIASLGSGGYPRRTGQIDGPGTETSDSIPAMLSDGEFVMTAKAVRGAGNGSRRAGAKKMYALMHRLEKNAAKG